MHRRDQKRSPAALVSSHLDLGSMALQKRRIYSTLTCFSEQCSTVLW